ncbi:MAG: SH3 domain-containing protein [Clostridia bacterium]|nr:SH3 domain-containing protein [Clostridia bacterium]
MFKKLIAAARITTLKLGQRLTVIGQTNDWYKAIDSVTGRTGYVSKSFVKKV